MHQFASPPNPPELFGNSRSQLTPIISTREIDHSRVQVKARELGFRLIGPQNVVEEIGLLHLKGSRKACRPTEHLRMFPGQNDAANPAHRRAQESSVRSFRSRPVIRIYFWLEFFYQKRCVVFKIGVGVRTSRTMPATILGIPS